MFWDFFSPLVCLRDYFEVLCHAKAECLVVVGLGRYIVNFTVSRDPGAPGRCRIG